jgi:amino acid transporter
MSVAEESVTAGATPAEVIPALDPSSHELARGAVSVTQSVIISMACSAPGQSMAVTLSALLIAANYGGPATILIMMLPMLAIALSYQRLNRWEQNCGGSYVWAGRAISPYFGFFVGWLMLAGYLLGTASNIFPLGPAVLSLFGANVSSQLGQVISSVLLMGVISFLAVRGVQLTARFQLLIAGIEYVILLVFCALGLYAEFISRPKGTVEPSLSWLSPTGIGGKGSLVAGALIAVYLFSGWDSSIYLNEETERPERNPGRAVLISVAILGVFFALIMFSLQGAASAAGINNNSGSALVYIAQQLTNNTWAKFMAFAVVLSVLGTTQATLISVGRISYSMSTDRVLFGFFGKINQRFKTPLQATLFFSAVGTAILVVYVYSSTLGNAFSNIVDAAGVMFAIFYALTGVTTAWFYRRVAARSPRDFFLVAVLPLAAAGVLGWVGVKSIIAASATEAWTLVGIAVTGAAMMAIARLVYRSPFFAMKRAVHDPATGTAIEST